MTIIYSQYITQVYIVDVLSHVSECFPYSIGLRQLPESFVYIENKNTLYKVIEWLKGFDTHAQDNQTSTSAPNVSCGMSDNDRHSTHCCYTYLGHVFKTLQTSTDANISLTNIKQEYQNESDRLDVLADEFMNSII